MSHDDIQEKDKPSRRDFVRRGTAGLFGGCLAAARSASGQPQTPSGSPGESAGTMVSTQPGRGNFNVKDFATDSEAVQHAYDAMVTTPGRPKTLLLDPSARPFQMDRPLDVWQSRCRVTSTGGLTLVPDQDYKGPLIQTSLRKETKTGEDGVICNLIMDNLWLNGCNRSLGIKLRNVQLSTIHSVHVRSTDGPGLWLSDGCIENLFSNLILSDRCGNKDQPALLIETESESRPKHIPDAIGNMTVNSTHFSGTMIHWPVNQALRIAGGPAPVSLSRRHRKIQFSGCYFHGHGGADKPVVTVSDAFELAFVGTQMLAWREDGCVMQLGERDARWPTGIVLISHCIFGSKPNSDTTGIRLVNVEENTPCLAVFGNSFGSHDARLGHAVDWGPQKNKQASWAANVVHVKKDPHIGELPANADVLPFA